MEEQVKGQLQGAGDHSSGRDPRGEGANEEGKRRVGSEEVQQGREGWRVREPHGPEGLQPHLTSQ